MLHEHTRGAEKKLGAIIQDHDDPVDDPRRGEKHTPGQENITEKEQHTTRRNQDSVCGIGCESAGQGTGGHGAKYRSVYCEERNLSPGLFSPLIKQESAESQKKEETEDMRR